MEATIMNRMQTASSRFGALLRPSASSELGPVTASFMRSATQCHVASIHKQGVVPPGSGDVQLGQIRRAKQLWTLQEWRRSDGYLGKRSGQHFQTSAAHASRQNPAPSACSSSEDAEPAGGASLHPALGASLSSSEPLPADNLKAQFPNPLPSLAHTSTPCRETLVSGLSSVTSSTVAAARFLVWFLSGQYIPSRLRVLITLLRAERYYRKHIRTIDPQQLLHELDFLPELPIFEALFPALAYAAVLVKAIGALVPALGSFSLLQGSAGVPGLPEVELPTIGPSTAYEYPDKSDQPSTPGYKPLGEWIGPRGMKPWERNAVTISKEERKKLWDKNFKEYTLQPFNSTPRERKALVILAAISTSLTWMWILLHALLVPLLFIGLMVIIDKPFFWALGQLYKLRRFVGGFRGPMYKA